MKNHSTCLGLLVTSVLLASSATGQVARTQTDFVGGVGVQSGALTLMPEGNAAIAYLGYSGRYSSMTSAHTTGDRGRTWGSAFNLFNDFPILDGHLFSGATHIRAVSVSADSVGCCFLDFLSFDHNLSARSKVSLVDGLTYYVLIDQVEAAFEPDPLGGDDDTTYVVYGSDLNGPTDELWFTKAVGKDVVIPQYSLFTKGGSSSDSMEIAIGCEGDFVYVAFEDDGSGTDSLVLRSSADGGLTFGPENQFHDSMATIDTNSLQLTTSGDSLAIAWTVRDGATPGLYTIVSGDRGQTFSSPVLLDASGKNPILMYSQGRPLVCWGAGNAAYSATSIDGGQSFITQQVAADLESLRTPAPGADVNSLGVVALVVVGEVEAGQHEIFSLYSLDGGLTWEPDSVVVGVVSNTLISSLGTPMVEVDDTGNVFCGWKVDSQSLSISGYAIEPLASSTPFSVMGNQDSLTAEPAILGSSARIELDLQSTGHATGVVFGSSGTGMTPAFGQFVLVDASAPIAFSTGLIAGSSASFDAGIPNDPALLGNAFYLQGVHLPSPLVLTNRVDLVVGAR